jgi:hypothetical protein
MSEERSWTERVWDAADGHRISVRGKDGDWQWAVLILRADWGTWWPAVRYEGVFETAEAALDDARRFLQGMTERSTQ